MPPVFKKVLIRQAASAELVDVSASDVHYHLLLMLPTRNGDWDMACIVAEIGLKFLYGKVSPCLY